MSKKFTFYQLAWNGGAIHFNQWHLSPVAFFVDPSCDKFFTNSIFACNQDPGFGRRNFFDRILNFSDAELIRRSFLPPC